MTNNSITSILAFVMCIIGISVPALCQEAALKQSEEHHGSVLAAKLGPDDVILPVTAVEWGTPDRWSLTARYILMFTRDRDHRSRIDSVTAALIPGTDGARLTAGYQGIFKVFGMKDAALFVEPRAVLLRTWGHPLRTKPDRTFAGAEMNLSTGFFGGLGAGWYRQISSHEGRPDSFWGIHIGFGI